MLEVDELDLSIDENNLDAEWQRQPVLLWEYGRELADYIQEAEEAKSALAVVTAELEMEIRNNPDAFDIPKVTEAAVQAAIPRQPEHIAASTTLQKAKHAARVYQAAVDAITQRKAALQGMTELYMRQWYADPEMRATEADAQYRKPVAVKTGRRPRKARVKD